MENIHKSVRISIIAQVIVSGNVTTGENTKTKSKKDIVLIPILLEHMKVINVNK